MADSIKTCELFWMHRLRPCAAQSQGEQDAIQFTNGSCSFPLAKRISPLTQCNDIVCQWNLGSIQDL